MALFEDIFTEVIKHHHNAAALISRRYHANFMEKSYQIAKSRIIKLSDHQYTLPIEYRSIGSEGRSFKYSTGCLCDDWREIIFDTEQFWNRAIKDMGITDTFGHRASELTQYHMYTTRVNPGSCDKCGMEWGFGYWVPRVGVDIRKPQKGRFLFVV